jgi:hypothetical protein
MFDNENYSSTRVARGSSMNILSLVPESGRKIPVYSKGAENRDDLIKSYYKYCEITDSEINEINL